MKIPAQLLLCSCLMLFVCAIGRAQKPELVVQTGHSTPLNAVAFSDDGKTLASSGEDSTIKLWEVATGRQLRSLNGHSSEVFSLAFSRDGKMLASGSDDNTIKLWELATGRELRTLTGHTYPVFFVAFSADNQTLFSNSRDSTIRQWDVATGRELRIITKLPDVSKVALSPDGQMLASQSPNERIKLWDVATGRELRTLTMNFSSEVSALEFSPDGKMLAGSLGVTITLWDVNTGRELRMIFGVFNKPESLISIAFSRDGKILAGGFLDGTIKLWNVDSGQELRTLRGHLQRVTSVQFHVDGQTLASCGRDGKIKLWEFNTGRELRPLDPRALAIRSVAISRDGTTIVSDASVPPGTFKSQNPAAGAEGNKGRTIKVWDVATGRGLRTLTGHQGFIRSVAFTSDGKTLASGDTAKTIKLWDVANGRELYSLTAHSGWVRGLSFSGDGRKLTSTGDGGAIKLWEVNTGRELRTITRSSGTMALSPDGMLLAYENSGTIQLFDVAKGRELIALTGCYWIHSLAFSSDGKILAGGCSSTITIWDSGTGRKLRTLEGHSDSVNSLALSPDGKTLASGSRDQTIKLWDVPTGRELCTLTGHTHFVESVMFSGDGKFLVSGGGDATIRLWRVETGELLASLIALDDQDWAVVTPDGRFDASPNAQKLMHWMVGTEPIELEQLKERYYEPGLLAKLTGFNKEPLRNVSALGDIELFPAVNYAQPDANGKLKLELTNRGGGIGKVRVLVNGKEIAADARGPSPEPQAAKANLTVDLAGASIIPGQDNTVEVIAWNAEGYLSSRGVKILWTPPSVGDEAARHPDLYAIVVGISKYAGGSFDLTFAAKDAEDMAQALKVGAQGLFGAEKTHITLLNTSGNEGVSLPTKENIRKAFDSVAKQAKPWDVLVIYLSGHGVALGGAEDIYLYPTQEARALDSETLKDSALRQATSISSEELIDWLTKTEWVQGQKGLAPLKRVIILDTCAAGKLAEKLTRDPSSLSSAQIRAIDRLKDRTGYHVLMGSAADAVSYEASQYGQGLLTYSLLQGMRGAALREEQYVDVASLFQYAADEVPKLARNVRGIQRPIVAAPLGVSFDVGLLRTREEKSGIPLAQVKPILLRPRLTNRDETVGFDDLGLEPLLRERFKTESEVKARGATGSWNSVYINADEMPGAVLPSGIYVVNQDTVKITMNLIKDRKKIDSFQVEGNKSDKEALVLKILDGISGLMKKHEPELVTPTP